VLPHIFSWLPGQRWMLGITSKHSRVLIRVPSERQPHDRGQRNWDWNLQAQTAFVVNVVAVVFCYTNAKVSPFSHHHTSSSLKGAIRTFGVSEKQAALSLHSTNPTKNQALACWYFFSARQFRQTHSPSRTQNSRMCHFGCSTLGLNLSL